MWAPVVIVSLLSVCFAQESRRLSKEPSYVIVTPRKVRPNQVLQVSATILRIDRLSVTVRASVRSGLTEVAGGQQTFYRPATLPIHLDIPSDVPSGRNFSVRVFGFANGDVANVLFQEVRRMEFDIKQLSLFLTTNRPVYKQGQPILIRGIPIGPTLMPIPATLVTFAIYNPSGLRVRLFPNRATSAGGIAKMTYRLSADVVEYGVWKIELRCQGSRIIKEVTVVEWYPELFFSNVSMSTSLMEDDPGFKWRVHSIHIRPPGRPTKGSVTNYIDIRRPGAPHPEATFTVSKYRMKGGQNFFIPMAELRAKVPQLAGKVIRVEAHLTEWFFNYTAVGHQSAYIYPARPHLKVIGGNVTTFKPNVPFTIKIAVIRADGSPLGSKAKGKLIYLKIRESGTGLEGVRPPVGLPVPKSSIVEYSFTPLRSADQITMEATYNNDPETRLNLLATKFHTTTEAYLRVETSTKSAHTKEYIIFSVTSNMFVDEIYYHIVAGGNIIISDTLQMQGRHKVFSVALSRDMCPSARIVVYFLAPDGKMVGDSLHFHVSGIDRDALTVTFNKAKDQTLRSVEIIARSDPITMVVFSGVVASLYHLGARNGLTYEEVYKEIYTYDKHADSSVPLNWMKDGSITHTDYVTVRGHAYDTDSLFLNSGLFVFTDADVTLGAPRNSCRTDLGLKPCFRGDGCWHVERDKCNLRSAACPLDLAHMTNCEYRTAHPYNPKLYNDPWWRLNHMLPYFPDGIFVWTEQFTRPNGRLDSQQGTRGPPKAWAVSAFTISVTNGLLIMPEPAWFGARRTYQMGVRGPPSMRMREHAGIRVAVYNRWKEDMDVLVILHASKDYNFVEVEPWGVVSSAQPRLSSGEHHVLLPTRKGSFRQILLPITPTHTGRITVVITSRCVLGHQTARVRIAVTDVGIQEAYLSTYQVDMRRTLQMTLPDLRVALPEHPFIPEVNFRQFVPGSRKLDVHIHGSIVGTTFFPNTAFRLSVRNIFGQPYASGEQALFNLGLNAQVLKYERAMNTISGRNTGRVVETMNNCLQEIYAFINKDGSVNAFRWSKTPSVWVTAFAAQTFIDTVDGLIDMQPHFVITGNVPRKAIQWLADRQDNVTGEFREISEIFNRRMDTGLMRTGINGTLLPANCAMTAHVTITLIKANAAGYVAQAQQAMERALTYLQSCVQIVTDPFEMAIVAYALSLDGKQLTPIGQAFDRLEQMARISGQGGRWKYWAPGDIDIPELDSFSDSRQFFRWKEPSMYDSYAAHATSYVVLGLIQRGLSDQAKDYQAFLQMCRQSVGGMTSTQDTIVALEALRKLSALNLRRNTYGITYNVTSTASQEPWYQMVNAHQTKFPALHSVGVPTKWGNVHIEARGFGIAQVQMVASSHLEFRELLRPLPMESFKYDISIFPSGFNHSVLAYTLCSSFNGEVETSGTVVVGVDIPSGYVADNWTLQAEVKNVGRISNLASAYFYDQRVNLYFHSMNHSMQCVNFVAKRWYPVAGIAERQRIRFQELYEGGHFYLNFYRVVMLFKNNVCQVCASYQCPYCPGYSAAAQPTASFTLLLVAIGLLYGMIS